MCRRGDTGAYEVGNVYIGTWSQNTAERNTVHAAKKRHTARTTSVTFVGADGTRQVETLHGDMDVPF